jgi:hypothetical protein
MSLKTIGMRMACPGLPVVIGGAIGPGCRPAVYSTSFTITIASRV